MGSDHAITGNSHTELTAQGKALHIEEPEVENELENRMRNIDQLVHSVHGALLKESFSGKPGALDLMNDLRLKIKTTHNTLRVAKLLSEPARESMLSSVRNSLNDLESVIASRLGTEMT